MNIQDLVDSILKKYEHINMEAFDRYDICYHDLRHFGLSPFKFKIAIKILSDKLFPDRVKITLEI